MDKPVRGWIELIQDAIDLFTPVIADPKFVELLDEAAQLLDLPDPFPNVDGLQSDDQPTETPSVESVMRAAGALNVQKVTTDAATDKPARKHATLADIFGKR